MSERVVDTSNLLGRHTPVYRRKRTLSARMPDWLYLTIACIISTSGTFAFGLAMLALQHFSRSR